MKTRNKQEASDRFRFTSQEEMLGDSMVRTSALWVQRCLEYYRDEAPAEPPKGNAGMYNPDDSESPAWP